ncbi:hypothetical protein ElyMa_000200700 [Elysia marginata]|uniref:Uncharacterized protein n=1 Tax=Elysia marginata TaxID=1093978 RepID=A0AAV4EYU0_9GAST|nr:hypothetical protein ElyMa_000200700 [Elysia marginata]
MKIIYTWDDQDGEIFLFVLPTTLSATFVRPHRTRHLARPSCGHPRHHTQRDLRAATQDTTLNATFVRPQKATRVRPAAAAAADDNDVTHTGLFLSPASHTNIQKENRFFCFGETGGIFPGVIVAIC